LVHADEQDERLLLTCSESRHERVLVGHRHARYAAAAIDASVTARSSDERAGKGRHDVWMELHDDLLRTLDLER
jgi:hypothetical protein